MLSSKNNFTKLNNRELILLIQNNDEMAKEVFVEKNMGLVYTCMKRFANKSNSEDLIQIGCVGLMKALNAFDLSKNLQFSTYAIPIILGEIRRYFRDEGPMRISRSIKENYSKLFHIREEFFRMNGYEPSYEDLSQLSGISLEDVYISFDAHQYVHRLDDEIHENDGKKLTLNDKVKMEEKDELLKIGLNHEISLLDKNERLILYFRYSLGYKQSEIAERLYCTQVQISRMEKQILKKLRNKME